ncbi:MAG: M20/M25/M40 family metallo-hydrolase [Chitinophagales bacterium]
MKRISFLLAILFCCEFSFAQKDDSIVIRKIFDQALTKSQCYQTLTDLTTKIGGRLAGSPQAAQAVEMMKKVMDENMFDSVWLQPCYVPHWVRGEKETAYAQSKGKKTDLTICALGNSIGTGNKGITAEVIEVNNFKQLDSLGEKNIKGKIVFYNHPFNDALINQFEAYGEAVVYRWAGPSRAAKYGAVGTVVRSMTSAHDDYPHTGAMGYNDTFPKIPCCAVSTIGAEKLSEMIHADPDTKFYFRQMCEMEKDSVLSYNVIGELRGTQFPKQFITVGGHLDSWETGKGAHDDGAGAVQSIEVLRIFKNLGIRPNHTIRCVLFMNEENGSRGGRMYASEAKRKGEQHLFAIESDAGGFSPLGFSFNGDSLSILKIQSWKPLFEPYHIHEFTHGGDGADVGHLQGNCKVLSGLSPDPQRYFDYHHAASDVIENVNKRELELGAAAMASLIFLIDKYGL